MEHWWMGPLRDVVRGRDVVIAGAVAAAWVDVVEHLRAAGAGSLMVVATEGRGAGPTPDVPTFVIEPPDGLSMLERLHHGLRSLTAPPPELVDAVEAFDPSGEAIVVGSFLNMAPELAGRPFVGYRRPEWVALEDKTLADDFWDRAGVARLDSAVVRVDEAAAAAPSLDCGAGTVWAADARGGFHGGGVHTHWVVDGLAAEVTERLRPFCDRVRVMPFVDGVATSIHGIVLPDGIAVLRPVELVTLRQDHDLRYSGCATFWDPPVAVREQMRDVGRRVGRQLRDDVDFRGTFTVDGVVDADGFWPTELNPRFGAGINVIAKADSDLPLMLLNELVVGGHDLGRAASELEAELVELADSRRAGGTWQLGTGSVEPIDDRAVSFDGGGWHWSEPGERPGGRVVADERFVRCTFEPAVVPVGPSVGGRSAAFWRFADAELGTDVGRLTAPPDVSRRV